MFRLEMLPAAHGDCLWIEYGSGTTVHRILIDGGPAHTYPALRERILHLPASDALAGPDGPYCSAEHLRLGPTQPAGRARDAS